MQKSTADQGTSSDVPKYRLNKPASSAELPGIYLPAAVKAEFKMISRRHG
jgi:hypothetical protein